MQERKVFKFYRSYYDVYNELDSKNKLMFIDALFERQFYGLEPAKLSGLAKFAYISQKHNIDAQVAGYEAQVGAIAPPTQGATIGGDIGATLEKKEEEKKKEEKKYRTFVHLSLSNDEFKKLSDLKFSKIQIDDILDSIENYKKNTNYKSLYLTALKWLKKEHGDPQKKEAPRGFYYDKEGNLKKKLAGSY